jgi:glycosyltransferase involved in cell wall biosynthesis
MERMKRIVFTVTNDLTYDRRMQRICSTLAEEGFDVLLIGRKLANSLPLTTKNYKEARIQCFFNKGKLFYIEYNKRLFWKLLFTRADIYSAIDLDTLAPNVLIAMLKGKKVVFDAHEYFSEVPEVVDRPKVKRIWEWVARTFIPKVNAAYTVGPALAGIFEQLYKVPFETVMNVPPLKEGHSSSPAGKYLLYQGALNKGRGLECLIDAMAEIDLPLKIAGEGDLSEELRKRVRARELQDKIEFLGFVKPDDLPALTQGAFVGLNLLEHMGQSYYFSLANKFFDYIHAGVPTLNMDFPEYRSLNDQYKVSLLLHKLDTKSIIDAVNHLIKDPDLYNRLSENCHLAKKELNWQKEQRKLVTLYRAL